jgi:small-conductance mechanosensitive channel
VPTIFLFVGSGHSIVNSARVSQNHRQSKAGLATQADQEHLDPVITAVQRFANFFLLLAALSIGLAHFGAYVNTLTITLIMTGLIIPLLAKVIITDALNGFIILTDQPFRMCDSIFLGS